MAISASQVKELREATGAGMLDCKKALMETDGNFDEAAKLLKEKGLAAVAKRSERATSEGHIFIRQNGTSILPGSSGMLSTVRPRILASFSSTILAISVRL